MEIYQSVRVQKSTELYSELEKAQAHRVATGAVEALAKSYLQKPVSIDHYHAWKALKVDPDGSSDTALRMECFDNPSKYAVDAALTFPDIYLMAQRSNPFHETCNRLYVSVIRAILPI